MRFQRALWRMERAGWLGFGGLVVLALAGVFAEGAVSRTFRSAADGSLTVEYDRLERNGATGTVRLHVDPAPTEDVAVRFGPRFFEAFSLEDVRPEPREQRGGRDGVTMLFDAARGERLTLYLSVRPQAPGAARGEIGIVGREPVRFAQFVLP